PTSAAAAGAARSAAPPATARTRAPGRARPESADLGPRWRSASRPLAVQPRCQARVPSVRPVPVSRPCLPADPARGLLPRRAKPGPMRNAELARCFRDLAAYLDMEDVPFKPRAYEKAAQAIEAYGQPLEEVHRQGGTRALCEIPGIGKSMADKLA